MNQTRKNKISPYHQKRLEKIGLMLREMRFSEGLNQNEFIDFGVSRRQIQRGEYSCNISLVGLFKLLDVYGYRLDEFFEDIE
jgi:transcriptional regulator with XRE-family HTH domain